MTDAFYLKNKIALITGAASGIGAATSRELARAGASVVIADLNITEGERLAAEIGNARAVEMDVTSAASIAKVIGGLQHLDILVNCAGIGLVGDISKTSEEDFDRIMRVNVNSIFLVTKAALPLLLDSHGSIVNIGSVAGSVGVKQRFAYCASKGALLQLVRQMAVDYASRGVRINAVGPGSVNTPFLTKYLQGLEDPAAGEVAIKGAHPLGRWAEPDEIADAIVYLAGPQSSFVTGQILMVDGGYTAR